MTTDDQKREQAKLDKLARDAFEQNKRTFQLCFSNPAGNAVLAYFADFCRAGETCVALSGPGAPIDIQRTLVLEGRREVFLEIQKFLNLTAEQIFAIATGRQFQTGEANE